MTKATEKNEIAELRGFLIKNFLIILAVVSITEYAILQLVNMVFLPIFQTFFFGKVDWNGRLSGSEILVYMILLLAELMILGVGTVLPVATQPLLQRAVQVLEDVGSIIVPEMSENLSIRLTRGESLFLFAVVFAIMILLIIPYGIGAVWYARITTRKVHEIQVKRDAMREEYNRRRNRMLSDIAHDLRTPITTIAGYSKALTDGMVDDPQKIREYLDAIQAKSARINDLIQLLFEYVKLSSDGFSLDKKPIDLSELMRKNAALMYSDVEDAGMEFEIDIPEEACMIEADEIQFSRAVTNLITNAIRHNKAGAKILLSLKKDDERLKIVVGDTGEKIEPNLADHLFEPFVMGDESRNTKGGSGLGLSIAHKIMKMHGWNLFYSEQIYGYTKGFVIENYLAENAK